MSIPPQVSAFNVSTPVLSAHRFQRIVPNVLIINFFTMTTTETVSFATKIFPTVSDAAWMESNATNATQPKRISNQMSA
jgi:hypothetical protein